MVAQFRAAPTPQVWLDRGRVRAFAAGVMKSIHFSGVLIVCALVLSCVSVPAETKAPPLDGTSAGAAAEVFLAGYIKADDKNSEWVAKTTLATPEFKAAFKKAMASEEVDADPVLFAQDVPSTPFKAESAQVKGGTATVIVTAKFGDTPFKLKVTLVAREGRWLVSKTERAK